MPEEERVYREMFCELNQYEKRGIPMKIEGNPASPTQIVQAHMIKEETGYMRDYVLDETGDLMALCFYRVKK